MADALAQLKQEFGRGAVILNTRTVSARGLFSMRGKPYVEITAARDVSDLPPAMRRGTVPNKSGSGERAEGAAAPMAPKTAPTSNLALATSLLSEVGSLRGMVTELLHDARAAKAPSIPVEFLDFHRRLVEKNVAVELADELIQTARRELGDAKLSDPAAVKKQLARSLAAMVPVAGPMRPRASAKPYVVALIGPTGVGKTTTVAKLAANASLRENRRVGLITLDTYRIAAVEQLKTYAQIIDVPLQVVSSVGEYEDALAAMSDRDIVLVDTAGRSQRDELKIKELQGFFARRKPHEIHLVLSAAADQRVLTDAVARFADVGFDRVIFTKLDEAIGFGVILNCLRNVNARLSYLTTGQDVPDDIQTGQGKRIAELILSPDSVSTVQSEGRTK